MRREGNLGVLPVTQGNLGVLPVTQNKACSTLKITSCHYVSCTKPHLPFSIFTVTPEKTKGESGSGKSDSVESKYSPTEVNDYFTEALGGEARAVQKLQDQLEGCAMAKAACYLPLNAAIDSHLWLS